MKSELPIAGIRSNNDFEWQPYYEADGLGYIITYLYDTAAIDDDLFYFVFEFDEIIPDGHYKIDIEIVEVTDIDAEPYEAVSFDGAVIVDNTYPKGDVTKDGIVDNRDLILIARYLVHLVEFDAKQKAAADSNDDGLINNTDLVLIARAIVSGD